MWPVFAVLIAINLLSVVGLAVVALTVGGNAAPAEVPSAETREVRVARIDAAETDPPARTGATAPRGEIPPEYRRVEPAPSPWILLPDGSVRFSRSD